MLLGLGWARRSILLRISMRRAGARCAGSCCFFAFPRVRWLRSPRFILRRFISGTLPARAQRAREKSLPWSVGAWVRPGKKVPFRRSYLTCMAITWTHQYRYWYW